MRAFTRSSVSWSSRVDAALASKRRLRSSGLGLSIVSSDEQVDVVDSSRHLHQFRREEIQHFNDEGRVAAALEVGTNRDSALVEWAVDLGNLGRLACLVRRRLVGTRLAAEVEAEPAELEAVAADLLQRRQQLRLGLGPRVRARRDLLGRLDLDPAVALQPRRGRDQLADDDVLLQTEQPVDLPFDRRVRQDLRRLLEGGRRQEGLGRERRLRDAEDERLERRLLALRLLHAEVLALEHDLVHELAGQELRRARVVDPDLLQHLPADQLDVLVVDVDALRLVDLLHLAHEVQLGRRRALLGLRVQVEQLCRGNRTLHERIALFDVVALLHEQPRAAREEVLALLRLSVLLRRRDVAEDRDAHRAAVRLLDVDRAADLRELRGTLRVPRLEDLDDTREAVRDVRARDAAGVERPHRQLRPGLSDRLRGDDADRVADLRERARAEEDAVAGAAHAVLAAALEHRANRDEDVLERFAREQVLELAHRLRAEDGALLEQHLRARRPVLLQVVDVFGHDPPEQALVETFARDVDRQLDVVLRLAVLVADDHVLRDVDEAPREVTRVGRAERGVGETLARAVRRDEVLEHRQAFHEVRLDRPLDDLALRIRHQAAHAGELADLRERATRTRVGHHEDRVELVERALHRVGHRVGRLRPEVDDDLVPFLVGDQAAEVLALDGRDPAFELLQDLLLLRRNDDVVLRDRDAGPRRIGEAERLDRVEHRRDRRSAVPIDELGDEVAHLPLRERVVDVLVTDTVEVHRLAERAVDLGVEDHASGRGQDQLAVPLELDRILEVELLRVERELDLLLRPVAARARLQLRGVCLRQVLPVVREEIAAEDHVLRRRREHATARRREDVVRGEHQDARLGLRLRRQGQVDGHLVAVEVRVEGVTHEWVYLDRLALDEHRLERLDAEAVQRRCAVQQHRMLRDHLLEHVPDLRDHRVDVLLRRLDVLHRLALDEPAHDERLEELERHQLRQAALVQPHVRP